MISERETLLKILKTLSYEEGEFILKSGKNKHLLY